LKKTALAIILLSLIALSFATWLILNQMANQAENQIAHVKIADFKWTSDWGPGTVGILWCRSFNITLNNIGNQDLEGIKVEVKFLANNTELWTSTWFHERGTSVKSPDYPNMTFELKAGEICELLGTFYTKLTELDKTQGEKTLMFEVISNGTTLDDLSLPYTIDS